jgi:hypothetical protein
MRVVSPMGDTTTESSDRTGARGVDVSVLRAFDEKAGLDFQSKPRAVSSGYSRPLSAQLIMTCVSSGSQLH